MLEALIRITDGPQGSPKAKGDIICVKLSPAVWGTLEQKRFLVVKHEDAELEQQLLDQQKAGEPYPVISLPYAKYETVQGAEILKSQSTKFVDVDKIAAVPKEDVDDKTKEKPKLEKESAPIIDRPEKVRVVK